MVIAAKLEELAAHYGLLYRDGTSPDGLPEVSVYSKDMGYRYAFARWWGEGPLVLWVLLNPTTRDTKGGQRQTLRRCITWSRSWDNAGLIIGNLFAFRDNDPEGLRKVTDPVGPLNDAILEALDTMADRTVVAWGYKSWLHGRTADVGALLRQPLCLGVTQSGEPRHPLYVRGGTPLQPWRV